MKAKTRNPKSERTPKSQGLRGDSGWSDAGQFWTWGKDPDDGVLVLKDEPSPASPPDLLERAARFGEAIIRFAKKIPPTAVNQRLVEQLVGAGTSVGANYCEADNAVSGKDFKNRIGTCRKESRETMFFLRMIATAEPSLATEARQLWREAREPNLIFGSIWRK